MNSSAFCSWCNTLFMAAALSVSLSFPAAAFSRTFDVRQFGAAGDGKTADTVAVQKALDACANAGGGVVRFSAGTYLCQPLTLHGRTTVQIDAGATLLASPDPSDFLKGGGDWLNAKSSSNFVAFLSGSDLTNVTLTGAGTIDGNGAVWWPEAEKARQRVSGFTLPRPNLVVFTRCKNVRLSGIRLANSPKFHLVPVDCENVQIDHVSISAPAGAANTDGIDPSNCRNVSITHCTIDTGDDNIAVKSGKKVPGRKFGCENIDVRDCIFLHGHGMSIGSETIGGIHRLVVKNCRFDGTDNGIRIKSRRGKGGLVEDVSYSDITMTNVHSAISIMCYYQDSSEAKYPKNDPAQVMTNTTPIFRDIRILNVTAMATADAGFIVGLPESPVSDVLLRNVHLQAQTGLTMANTRGIALKKVEVSVEKGSPFILDNAQVIGLPLRR